MNIEIKQASDINEEFLMTLLCIVGEAKTAFMQAMLEARNNNFGHIDELISQGDKALANVHKCQTTLIGFDEGAGKVPMTLILTHIQDHIMTTMLCRELALEIIDIRRKISE